MELARWLRDSERLLLFNRTRVLFLPPIEWPTTGESPGPRESHASGLSGHQHTKGHLHIHVHIHKTHTRTHLIKISIFKNPPVTNLFIPHPRLLAGTDLFALSIALPHPQYHSQNHTAWSVSGWTSHFLCFLLAWWSISFAVEWYSLAAWTSFSYSFIN